MSDRKLVLVVGNDSKERRGISRDLIAVGNAVVLCSGPPGCPLVRDEPCVLTETADLTVLMPSSSRVPEVVAGLRLCAAASQRVIAPEGLEPV